MWVQIYTPDGPNFQKIFCENPGGGRMRGGGARPFLKKIPPSIKKYSPRWINGRPMGRWGSCVPACVRWLPGCFGCLLFCLSAPGYLPRRRCRVTEK